MPPTTRKSNQVDDFRKNDKTILREDTLDNDDKKCDCGLSPLRRVHSGRNNRGKKFLRCGSIGKALCKFYKLLGDDQMISGPSILNCKCNVIAKRARIKKGVHKNKEMLVCGKTKKPKCDFTKQLDFKERDVPKDKSEISNNLNDDTIIKCDCKYAAKRICIPYGNQEKLNFYSCAQSAPCNFSFVEG